VGNDQRMRAYLSKAPRWIMAVIIGLPFGIMMGIYTKIDGPMSSAGAVLEGLVAGVFFGVAMAFSIDKRRRAMRAAVGDLPTGEAKAARRAADRGPIPTDPEIRAAAVRIATQQLDLLRPVLRRRFIVAMVLLLTFSVVGAVIESPWYLLYALVPALLLTSLWYLPRRIRRRIRLLSEGTNVFTE
jgi:Flp pilus assembly protein TadB